MTLTLRDDIACFYEGTTEKAILDLLIDKGKLIFERDNLVDESFLPAQNLAKKNINNFSERVLSQVSASDKMDIVVVQDRNIVPVFPKIYSDKIGNIVILQTKPEIEMLLIHHYGWFNEYQKVKSKVNPKKFLAQKLQKPEKAITSYKEIQKSYTAEMFVEAIVAHAKVSQTDGNAKQLVEILKPD